MIRILIAFFILCSPAFGATYYIDFTAGDDSRTSVQAQSTSTPWKHCRGMSGATGNAASYSVQAGDTFVFKGGETWPEASLPLDIPTSGSDLSSNAITYTADETWYTGGSFVQPKFDQEDMASENGAIKTNAKDYIIIDNIHIESDDADTGSYGIWVETNSDYITIQNCLIYPTNYGIELKGEYISGGRITNIVIDNVTIHEIWHEGIRARWGMDNITIKNSLIYDGNHTGADGIQFAPSAQSGYPHAVGVTIQDNNIHDFPYKGCILVSADDVVVERNLIWNDGTSYTTASWGLLGFVGVYGTTTGTVFIARNNVLYGQTHFGGLLRMHHDCASEPICSVSGVKIYNNSFYGTGNADDDEASCIKIAENNGTDWQNVEIKNNIFHTGSNTERVISFTSANTTSGAVISNNVYYYGSENLPFEWEGTQYNYADWVTQTGDTGSVNNSDPAYVNPGYLSSSDFTITTDSPAINAGATLSGFSDDKVGVSRPEGVAWDIGAYEFGTPTNAITGVNIN